MERFNTRILATGDLREVDDDDMNMSDVDMDDADDFTLPFGGSDPSVAMTDFADFSDDFSAIHRTVSEDSVMAQRAGPYAFLPAPVFPKPVSLEGPHFTSVNSLGDMRLQKMSEMSASVLNLRQGSTSIPIPAYSTEDDVSGQTPPAVSSLMLEDDDFMPPSSQSPSGSFSTDSLRLRESYGGSPSRFVSGNVTFRGERPPTPSNMAPSPPHAFRSRSSAMTSSAPFVRPDQDRQQEIEMNRRMRDEQIWMQSMADATPETQTQSSGQPIYRDGNGNAMMRRAPLLSTRNRPRNATGDLTAGATAAAAAASNLSAVTRCQSMPTTELERLFVQDADPLPLINTASSSMNEISPATMVDLMNGVYKEQFHGFYIIDCRYPYEYEGGHIKGAMQMPPHQAEATLTANFMNDKQLQSKKMAIVFHCEFSSKRGPAAYKMLRDMDRKANRNRYPKMFFPHIYLLKDGYKEFFRQQPQYCEPQQYIEMKDSNFSQDLKLFKSLESRSKRQRTLSQSMSRLPSHHQITSSAAGGGRTLSRSQTVSNGIGGLRDNVRRSGSFVGSRANPRVRRQRSRTRQGSNLTHQFERM